MVHVKRLSMGPAHLDMIQHELFLPKVHGAVGAFEHRHFVIDDMLVEVRAEQGLQREHGVTHGTLVDHPAKQKRKKHTPVRTKSRRRRQMHCILHSSLAVNVD